MENYSRSGGGTDRSGSGSDDKTAEKGRDLGGSLPMQKMKAVSKVF